MWKARCLSSASVCVWEAGVLQEKQVGMKLWRYAGVVWCGGAGPGGVGRVGGRCGGSVSQDSFLGLKGGPAGEGPGRGREIGLRDRDQDL